MKLCKIDSCDRKHLAKGFCNKHYLINKRGGDAKIKSAYDMTPLERLLKFTKVNSQSGCWEWFGSKVPKGYGHLSFKNKVLIAHRLSYEIHFGAIPDSILVCHKCDNPCCINPDHLFLGTTKDNYDDMIHKNRQKIMSGELNGNSKLKSDQACQIKDMILNNKKLVEIAHKFHVSPENIANIKNGKTWRNVNV